MGITDIFTELSLQLFLSVVAGGGGDAAFWIYNQTKSLLHC